MQTAAKRNGVSINQFIATAVAEKLAALLTEDYLLVRGQLGSREAYLAALAQVRNIKPVEEDARRLP